MNVFKIGGIWFGRVGRTQVSFCRVGRERHASYRMRRNARARARRADYQAGDLIDVAIAALLIAAGALGAAGYVYAHLGASASALGLN